MKRALFFDLVELGEEREVNGERMFGVVSAGEFFGMAPAARARSRIPLALGFCSASSIISSAALCRCR